VVNPNTSRVFVMETLTVYAGEVTVHHSQKEAYMVCVIVVCGVVAYVRVFIDQASPFERVYLARHLKNGLSDFSIVWKMDSSGLSALAQRAPGDVMPYCDPCDQHAHYMCILYIL
jgi:hypothetical protein